VTTDQGYPVAGLDPGIHVFLCLNIEDVDVRDKPGQGDWCTGPGDDGVASGHLP